MMLAAFCTDIAATADDHPRAFDKLGLSVVGKPRKIESDMILWTVEKNGIRTIFYQSPDGKTLISGIMLDAVSAKNISDPYVPEARSASTAPTPSPSAAIDAMRVVDGLLGFKEGNASFDKTLYIVFDPLCPHCHANYAAARTMVRQGMTIKWVPIVMLGNAVQRAESVRQIAGALASSAPDRLDQLFARKFKDGKPSQDLIKELMTTEDFFLKTHAHNPQAGPAVVPTVYFLTENGVANFLPIENDDGSGLREIAAGARK
jgi:thiol:disulfide interchange protein DsbG